MCTCASVCVCVCFECGRGGVCNILPSGGDPWVWLRNTWKAVELEAMITRWQKRKGAEASKELLAHRIKWLLSPLNHRSSKVDQIKKSYDVHINTQEDKDDYKPIKSDICICLEQSKDKSLEIWVKWPIISKDKNDK